MIRYTPLDATLHRNAGLQSPPPGQGPFLHATGTTACRLLASELDQALAYYPLGFREIPGDSHFDLIAILSLEPGVNYYASSAGYWHAPYIPGWFRGHPFRLLPKEGGNQHLLCVNMDSERFTAEAGADDQRLFLADGTPSEQLQAILKFWTAYESEYHKTLALIRQLDQHGLIVPWPIQLREGAQAPAKNLEGFFHIDARRLQECSGDVLRELAQSGALRLAYAQLLSIPRMAGLVDMMRLRQSRQTQAPATPAVNFGLGGDTLDLSFLKN
jgi:hypothetical protein